MTELAISGGTPAVPKRYERFTHPDLAELDLADLVGSQRRKQTVSFDGGGLVNEMEAAFAELTGVRYALATNSGTSALYASYYAIGLGEGDEVLVPAYTFFATAMPLFRLGCQPVLVDCTANGNVDPADLRRKASSATRAIVVTHMWGIPCDMDEIMAIAAELGVPVVEDASHSHGATYHSQVTGSFGAVSAWSLGAAKIVTGGQGGILQSNDLTVIERARVVSRANDKQRDKAVTLDETLPYAVTGVGLNLRIHPFSAAVVLQQLPQLSRQLEERRAVGKYLADALSDVPGLRLAEPPEDSEPAWYALPLLYDAEQMHGVRREVFVEAMIAEGAVETDIPGSTRPLTAFRAFTSEPPTYAGAPYSARSQRPEDFPAAERFHNSIVKLPGWYGLEGLAYAQAYVAAIHKVVSQLDSLPTR